MGPQQAVHSFQHCLQLLFLSYFRLCHLGHIQLAAGQFFCNRKVKSQEAECQEKLEGLRAAQSTGHKAVPSLTSAKAERIITRPREFAGCRVVKPSTYKSLVFLRKVLQNEKRSGKLKDGAVAVPLGKILCT